MGLAHFLPLLCVQLCPQPFCHEVGSSFPPPTSFMFPGDFQICSMFSICCRQCLANGSPAVYSSLSTDWICFVCLFSQIPHPTPAPNRIQSAKETCFTWKVKSGPPSWRWYWHGPQILPSESSPSRTCVASLLSSHPGCLPAPHVLHSLCMCCSLLARLREIHPSGLSLNITSSGSPSLTPAYIGNRDPAPTFLPWNLPGQVFRASSS